MTILTVGPHSTYHTIAGAMAHAHAGDTVALEAGFSNKNAVDSVDNMFISGDASSLNIQLSLAPGANTLTLLGAAPFAVHDNGGDNTITGNAGDNVFKMTGGNDVVHGGGGTDLLMVDYSAQRFGVTATTTSITDGHGDSVNFDGITDFNIKTGAGNDKITFGDSDNHIFSGGGSDNITLGNGENWIDSGLGNDTIKVGDGENRIYTGTGTNTVITGNGETYVIGDVGGNDNITTGSANDTLKPGTGHSTVNAGAGDDNIFLVGGTNAVNGGLGSDTVDYSGMAANVHVNLTLTGAQVVNAIETDTLTSVENINGSIYNDTLTGNAGNNVIAGGAGADHLNGGGGTDTFIWGPVTDSTSTAYDVLTGFDASSDLLDFKVAVGQVDPTVATGALSTATFDGDLAASLNASHLLPNDAVLFTPDTGTLGGHTFLVVDANGVAGYQAGQDFVVELVGAVNLGSLSVADFV